MCFGRNINGNRNVKFWIGIIGHCTDGRNHFTLGFNMDYIKVSFKFENSESAAAFFHASYRTHLLRRDVRRKLDSFFSVKMCI